MTEILICLMDGKVKMNLVQDLKDLTIVELEDKRCLEDLLLKNICINALRQELDIMEIMLKLWPLNGNSKLVLQMC